MKWKPQLLKCHNFVDLLGGGVKLKISKLWKSASSNTICVWGGEWVGGGGIWKNLTPVC